METTLVQELRRIAINLKIGSNRFADDNVDRRLQELKKTFLENMKKCPSLSGCNAEEVWRHIKDEIRAEIRRQPQDWRAD